MTLPPGLTHPSILLFFAASCGEMPSFDYSFTKCIEPYALLEEKDILLKMLDFLVSKCLCIFSAIINNAFG